MITETTAISIIAFGTLSTGLGIAAGLGWMRSASLHQWAVDGWNRACTLHREEKARLEEELTVMHDVRDKWMSWHAEQTAVAAKYIALALGLQERLDIEAAKRSSITSRGNLTRAAKRKALVAATTAAVARANAADRAEPVRKAA